MNFLLINYEFPPIGAGASTATWHIGKELAAMGHKVVVLTAAFKRLQGYDFKDGIIIFRCPAIRKKISESNILEMASFVTSAFFFMPRLILNHEIEGAIVFFSFPCGPLGLWAKMLFKTPFVVSLRGGDVPGNEKRLDKIHRILTPLRRLVYKKSLSVVANSRGLKKVSEKADSCPVSIIPNGVDTNFFSPLLRKKHKKSFGIMFAGRLSEQKNLFAMFEQLARLKKKSCRPIKIHMAGDGPLKRNLQKFALESGLAADTKWHGWVCKKTLLKLYRESDCFINPSFCEGMPNSVLEAMSCGLPVIASNVPGNNDVIIQGQNGFLFDIGLGKDMGDLLEKLIIDSKLQLKLQKNARRTVEKKFSWARTAAGYANGFGL